MASGSTNNSGSAAPAATGQAKAKNPAKRKKFFYGYFPNKKYTSDYHDRPYSFYLGDDNSFEAIVNKEKLTEKLPKGWKLYFHDDDSKILDPERILRQVKCYRGFLKNFPTQINYESMRKSFVFDVDVERLEEMDWPSFSDNLQEKPEHTMSCLSLAMQLHLNEQPEDFVRKSKYLSLLNPRICNLELPVSTIKSLSMENDCGRLVRIRGTILQASDESIDFVWRVFKCGGCSSRQAVLQRDGKVVLPDHCKVCNQRGSNYDEDLDSYFSCAEQTQSLRLQEMKNVNSIAGRSDLQACLDVIVRNDLVNKITPGTDVMCLGIIKPRVEGGQERRYSLYMDVITLLKNDDNDGNNFDYTESDYSIVERVQMDPNPFRLLVQSLCPKIIGQEMVKAALILGMFSCSPRDFKGKRREAHILIVGDPGKGKTELLEACAMISPRGVFVSSNSCTNRGLSATMSHDSQQKAPVEAGALVMADRGVCCIDELDKIPATMDVLLDTMEDQVVNIAKAGIISQLRTKTSVLAAANPVGGHYNKTKRITENLKIPLPILSRFDVVFVKLDKQDSQLERRFLESLGAVSVAKEEQADEQDFLARLKLNPNEAFEPLPVDHFQKYISYANRKYLPELSHEAKLLIKEYYIHLRGQPFYSDIIPVTPRALLSLIRLTQARAKIDLVRVATKEHAQDVIAIIASATEDVSNITEEDIEIQANQQEKEPRQSKTKQLNNFMRLLQIRAKGARTVMFTKAELKELASRGGMRNFNEILDLLNLNGVLLNKGSETYQFLNM